MEGIEGVSPKTPDALSPQEINRKAIAEISEREPTLGKEAKIKFRNRMGSPLAGAVAALEEAATLAWGKYTHNVLEVGAVVLTDKTKISTYSKPLVFDSRGIGRSPPVPFVAISISIIGSRPGQFYNIHPSGGVQPTSAFYKEQLEGMLSNAIPPLNTSMEEWTEELRNENRRLLEKEIKRLSNLSPRDIARAFRKTIEDIAKRKSIKWNE